MERRSILAGQPVAPSSAAASLPLVDPWDGAALGRQQLAGEEEVERALALAFGARPACAALAPWRRGEILETIAQGVAARREELATLIVAEAGKPLTFARGEVDRCVSTFRVAADEARRPQDEVVAIDAVAAGQGRTGLVRRFPAGVVVGIAPFNFPLNLVAHKLAPAIAAGCPWILKPPVQAPSCALILAELAVAAGWPADGAHVLLVDNHLAQRLVQDERPAIVSFTGSDVVGWRLKALAGKKRVLLELGGSAPVIVHRDADLDLVMARVPGGAFAYAGQVCISVQRLLVHRELLPALRTRLSAAVEGGVTWGDPRREDTVSGPLIDERSTDRVQGWLDQAVAAGARVVAGGGREGPRMLRPVLLEGVPHDQPLWRQELFGPGLVLEAFDDLDHAIRLANDSPWGLQAGVFTRDVQALFQLHRGLEVGGVIHDDAPTFRVDQMPYGGVKDSGLGREGLRWAIADYTEPRLLVIRA